MEQTAGAEMTDPTTSDVFASQEDTSQEDNEKKPRRRRLSRIFFGFWIFVYLVGVIIGVLSLGFFGFKYGEVKRLKKEEAPNVCILFAKRDDSDADLTLSNVGLCDFTLAAQAAIILLFIGCVFYNIVLTVLAPKILSPLRILDLFLIAQGFLVSFAVSVVVHAGLSRTCDQYPGYKDMLWILTVGCILLCLLYGLLVVVYCIRSSQRRRKEKLEAYKELEEEKQ